MTDVIELLELVRTELDCDRLDGTRETDAQAKALATEIAKLTDAVTSGV